MRLLPNICLGKVNSWDEGKAVPKWHGFFFLAWDRSSVYDSKLETVKVEFIL